MDTPKPLQKPAHLLDDLESIRQLLGDDGLQPPLLTEMIDDTPQIPVLNEVIKPAQTVNPTEEPVPAPVQSQIPLAMPATATSVEKAPDALLLHLDKELRTAAQQIMQEVINDFTPHIETEIKRRLDAHMERLLTQL